MNVDTINKITDSIYHIHEMIDDNLESGNQKTTNQEHENNIQNMVLYWNKRHKEFYISIDTITRNSFFHNLTNHLVKTKNYFIQNALENLLYEFDQNGELTNYYNNLLHKRYDDFMKKHSKKHKKC